MERNNVNMRGAEARKPAQVVEYTAGGVTLKLGPSMIRKYLVSGEPEKVTDAELIVFMNLCRYNHLNPWLKEAYCIKYGNSPATMVVGKEAFQKRAEANPSFNGCESGIAVLTKDGELAYRKGTLKLPGDEIVGGYAEVWRKDQDHSTRIEVSYDEYVGKKKDGTVNEQWRKRPATMIRKVALVQALREAFPGEIGGIYTAEEQGEVELGSPYSESSTESAEAYEAEMHDPFSGKMAVAEEPTRIAQIGGLELEEIE